MADPFTKCFKYTTSTNSSFIDCNLIWTPGEWKYNKQHKCKDTVDRMLNCYAAYPHPYLASLQVDHVIETHVQKTLTYNDIILWEAESSGNTYATLSNPERIYVKFFCQNLRIIKQISRPEFNNIINMKIIMYSLRQFLSKEKLPEIYTIFDDFITGPDRSNPKLMKKFLKQIFDTIDKKQLHKPHNMFNVIGSPYDIMESDIDDITIRVAFEIPLLPYEWFNICELAINN